MKKSIANCLNNCFDRLGLYKGKIIAPKLPSLNFKGNESNFRPVTRRELYKVIDKLPTQKSAGPGYIPSWALKDCKLSIGTHLQFAINECINANTFPEILKEAYVTPIYKKGDRHNPENYRPISVTPTLAKIFERLLLEKMSEHLDMNITTNKNQFGFQKQKSCLNTIIALTEKINHYVEEKDIVLTIFLDLAKAFNSISLDIFIQKIEKYGFGENARVLLNSFLINRIQCVRNGLVGSDWTIINHGVPQGTVLGPLVFILYVNDFGEEIGKSSNVLQFADDTAILCHEKSEQCLEAKAKKILMETEQYMKQNKLTLNEGKTEIMVFKNEKLPTVKCVEFNSHSSKPTDEVRYLGVVLDKELTYQKQLNNLISKMALAIRSIYLVRNQIPLKARINLFRSLVLSHLEFSAIFFQSLQSYSIDRINKQIRWGIKVCFFRTKYDSAHKLLLENKILPGELQIAKTSLNRLFDIVQQTKIQDQKNSE